MYREKYKNSAVLTYPSNTIPQLVFRILCPITYTHSLPICATRIHMHTPMSFSLTSRKQAKDLKLHHPKGSSVYFPNQGLSSTVSTQLCRLGSQHSGHTTDLTTDSIQTW